MSGNAISATSRSTDDQAEARGVSRWLSVAAGMTLFSCVGVVLCDFVGWSIVEKHSPISETISKLAIGDYGWVMDLGLNLFAGGMVVLAIGLFSWGFGGTRWNIATGLLFLTAIVIAIISEYDQYKGFDGFGADVHFTCCYLLYGFVSVAAICFGLDLKAIGRFYSRYSFGFAAVWLIGGPIFMFAVPNSIDGAVERTLAVGLVSWTAMLAYLLLLRGRGRLS